MLITLSLSLFFLSTLGPFALELLKYHAFIADFSVSIVSGIMISHLMLFLSNISKN